MGARPMKAPNFFTSRVGISWCLVHYRVTVLALRWYMILQPQVHAMVEIKALSPLTVPG